MHLELHSNRKPGEKWNTRCESQIIHGICLISQPGCSGKLRFIPVGVKEVFQSQAKLKKSLV
jgi:hypothetical protein